MRGIKKRYFHPWAKEAFPREYSIWYGLGARKYSPTYQRLDPLYDEEILNNFYVFLHEVGGPCPTRNYSVDRIDNDLGYIKGNLRWADAKTQSHNSRSLKWFYKGRPLVTVCEERGIGLNSVLARIQKLGWTMEEAVEIPFTSNNTMTKWWKKLYRTDKAEFARKISEMR